MRIKLCVLFLLTVIVVAAAGMGISYATNGLNTDVIAQNWCDVAFTSAEPGDPPDNEVDIDVGDVSVILISRVPTLSSDVPVNDGNRILVTVTTAYPGYEAYVDFTIKNMGTSIIDVNGIVLEDYNDTAMGITVTGFEGVIELVPGEELSGRLTISVLNEAEQNWQYPFVVGFGFSSEECDN